MIDNGSPVAYTSRSVSYPIVPSPSGNTSSSGRPSMGRAGIRARKLASASSMTSAGPRSTAMPGPLGNRRLGMGTSPRALVYRSMSETTRARRRMAAGKGETDAVRRTAITG